MVQIDNEDLKQVRSEFLDTPKYRNTQNAVMKNGIKKSITNQSEINSHPFVFSIDVDSNKVLNQKQSGRCWDFSGLNFIRYHIEKEHHIKDMELSPSYVYFYDKLEKGNYFYQNIINTADRPLSDRLVNWLLTTPQQDGGDWPLLTNLIEKYGLVPNELMPETKPAWNTTEINRMYNRKLDKDAMKLRDLVNNNASDTKIKSVIRQLNQENYRVLSICFGTPPEKFTYEYRDKNKKYHTTGEVTPLEFYKKFADINLDDYVELMNLPGGGYKYNQTYGIELCNNVVGGKNIRYLNVPMHDMRRMVIDQLKDDEPVWFACDVLQEWNNPAGLLSLKVYDWKRSFGISLGKDKATRVQYRESMPTHAMLICGVDLHDNEPTKWKVQNSWGDKPGHKGYFIMDNSWMDQYTYNTVVNKKYLTDTERAAYEKAEINLPYWTAMLSD
ncbi:C1 family peptidase [Lactobacillus johnsonii]|uniref:C1 family peptidase n=1 Tax=Lactobacillus johnsonii TaxID=33959 RepID=UPI00124B7D35|nr:C1 family peptidase [Lactobacillus johnsonii]KAB1958670.1 C1 family peptidase [Lactobacillus johnsonii]MCT3345988.1 peptidase C1 [Lactobacillus johnsonii]